MRVEDQHAYLLHTRAYRESSFLVELFTRDHGRVAAVARGARKQSGKAGSALQLFVPLCVSWAGRHDLKNLSHSECRVSPLPLVGASLLSGLYVNELLVRLLMPWDAHPLLFSAYEDFLRSAAQQRPAAPLRHFELLLLEELGYGISFEEKTDPPRPLHEDREYVFVPGKGFIAAGETQGRVAGTKALQGRKLLAVARGDYQDPQAARTAQLLTRAAIAAQLEGRPLHSVRFFASRNHAGRSTAGLAAGGEQRDSPPEGGGREHPWSSASVPTW